MPARPSPLLRGVMLPLIFVARFVFMFAVMNLWRYSRWTSILGALGLTQTGESSFMPVEVTKKSGEDIVPASSLRRVLLRRP